MAISSLLYVMEIITTILDHPGIPGTMIISMTMPTPIMVRTVESEEPPIIMVVAVVIATMTMTFPI